MNQEQIFQSWLNHLNRKIGNSDKSYYRLQNPLTQEFEYKGRQWGHPSNYAYVSFDCRPSDNLSFCSGARWPDSLSADYCQALEVAILHGVADILIGEADIPHVGCALVLVETKWDDVMSSELAFHRAAKGAMRELLGKSAWRYVWRKSPNSDGAT